MTTAMTRPQPRSGASKRCCAACFRQDGAPLIGLSPKRHGARPAGLDRGRSKASSLLTALAPLHFVVNRLGCPIDSRSGVPVRRGLLETRASALGRLERLVGNVASGPKNGRRIEAARQFAVCCKRARAKTCGAGEHAAAQKERKAKTQHAALPDGVSLVRTVANSWQGPKRRVAAT